MNLFVAGWSTRRAPDPRRAADAVRALLSGVPFLAGADVRTWQAPSGTAVVAWACDPPERVGGVEYVEAQESRLCLWAGRPVRWERSGRAEGRTPLDPGYYAPPAQHWARALDGRCNALRYDDGDRTLQAFVDPLGSYPLFTTGADGAVWISNRAEPLRALAGSRTVDLDALAGLLGGGWPLGGRPLWAVVEREAPGAIVSLHPGGGECRRELLGPAATAQLCGAGLDAHIAAAALVDSVRALAEWPGRPSVVPVTGGRDSRLVLAAALRAGISFDAVTGGAPDSPDVMVAAELCRAAGIAHHLLPASPHGDPWSATAEAARVLGLTTSGTASLADAAGFPLGPVDGPPVLWHSGQGGEIGRGYYRAGAARGRDAVVSGLERLFCGRRPGRAEPLSEDGRGRVRRGIEAWADARLAAGAHVADLPDLFYLDERMGSWAGPTHGAVEWVRDTTSPLWSVPLLPHLLGASVAERERQVFHGAVLRELAPELADVPYAATGRHGLRQKARRAVEELRRKAGARRSAQAKGSDASHTRPDPFGGVLSDVRAAIGARPGHVAWNVLDRARVEALLAREASALDEMSRAYVWRLATVFLDPAMDEARA